jgi:hypothetical protein
MWAWSAMVMMIMPAGDNSWLVHQSSLAVLTAEISGSRRRNGRRRENLASQYVKYLKRSLTFRNIFTTWDTIRRKVCWIFIALRNLSPRSGLNPQLLCPLANTLTTTPPWRPTLALYKASDKLHVPAAFARGRSPPHSSEGGEVSPRAGPDTVDKRKSLCLCLKPKSDCPSAAHIVHILNCQRHKLTNQPTKTFRIMNVIQCVSLLNNENHFLNCRPGLPVQDTNSIAAFITQYWI